MILVLTLIMLISLMLVYGKIICDLFIGAGNHCEIKIKKHGMKIIFA